MVSRWSFDFTKKSLEDVLRRLKEVLRKSPGRRHDDVLKKVVATSISDQSKTSLRSKLRRFYDVFATSLCRLGSPKPFLRKRKSWIFLYQRSAFLYDLFLF